MAAVHIVGRLELAQNRSPADERRARLPNRYPWENGKYQNLNVKCRLRLGSVLEPAHELAVDVVFNGKGEAAVKQDRLLVKDAGAVAQIINQQVVPLGAE